MATLLMDECLYHLHQVDLLMEGYKELDDYQVIFEAENPEVQETLVNNNKIESGVGSHLKKAAQAVMDMISKFIDFFKNIFGVVGMSKEERQLYENFKEACKKDPSLKNKQVTVRDFRETMKQYDALKKEVEQAERDLREGKETDCEKLLNKIKEFAAGAGKGIAVTVGLDAAVNIATTSNDFAKGIYSVVRNDEGPAMQAIVNSVGEKNAKKFQSTTKSLGKRISLKRGWMRLNHQICKDSREAISKTFNELKTIKGISKTFVKAQGNEQINQMTKDITGGALSSAKDAVKMSAKVAKNKALEKPRAFVDSKKVEKALKKGDTSGQSIMDSIVGGDRYKNKLKSRLAKDKAILDPSSRETLKDKMERDKKK